MLYNRNQFKKVNDKKVLHKVRKRWVVVSVALLGLLGAKSFATHANANADVNTGANNQQANHQIGNQSVKSTTSIVPDKSASLASDRTQASLSANHSVSASSTTVNASSASSQHQNSVAGSSVTSTSASDNNVSSEAQQIHDHVLSEFANNNRIPQTNKGVHLLGGSNQSVPKNNNSIMGQLMNIMHNNIQGGANEANAKGAYADLMSFISPSNLAYMSSHEIYAAKASIFPGYNLGGDPNWTEYINRVQSDLTKINQNGKSNSVLSNVVSKLNGITGQLNDGSLLIAKKQLNLDEIGTRFDTDGTIHKMLLGMVNNDEQKLDHIAAIIHTISHINSDNTLKNDYSNIINDLNKLPSQSESQQANTLSDLSNHISTFAGDISTQGNGYLPSQDKQYFSGITSNLNNAHQAIGKEASNLQNQITIANINNELNQYNVGSLFNDAVNYAASHNDYNKLNSVANDAKADLANATNASAFINNFVGQIADLKNADASTVRTDLNGMKDNSAVSDAYDMTKANSNAANNVLNNLASLNSANVTSNLDNVHNTISNNDSLAAINALNDVANSASTEATSVSESNAYKGLLNHESTLFSSVVNRINASGFNSNAFNTLVNNAKNDLANAANVSDFANDLNGQAGAFNGVTAQEIKNDLTNFVNNPEFSNAYQAIRTSSAAANNILNDLSGMNSDNEVAKLSDIANVASTNFSNSASFGSLATDAANMQTSISNDQSTAASKAYSSLLTNHESGLFSAVVNRINANGFNSNAFDTLVSNVKNDLAQASNASEFANRLASQDGNFNGVTAQEIKNDLTNFVNNPEFSNAYKAVHTSSNAADGILDDLSGMNSDNEVAKLSDIANVAKTDFSNSASFGSLATDATNMQTSVANVKNETPTQVTNVVHQATQNADDLSDNVNTTKNNMGSLASNYDGQQASTEMNIAVGYANDAKEYAQKAATDALAETGVHFTGLGVGTPDYVEDIGRVNNDVSKGNAALTDAKTDANLSQIDSELSNLNVKGLFNDVLNYVVSHNDYGKFNQAVMAANNAFNSKDNVTDFVNDFSNQVAELTNGNATTIKQLLKNHESNLTSAYQVAKDNSSAVNSALNDLDNLTSANASDQLNTFNNDLTNNGTFKQLDSLKQVAQVASNQANQINKINHINSLVNSVINPSFVQNAVQRLVNEPESKRSDFKQLVSDAKNALTNYDNASDFINGIENDQNFKKFTGNDAETVKSVLNGLNNSSVSSIINGYYNQVKAQKNNVNSILDDLSKIANDPYKSNASQNKSSLNDIYGTINGNSNLKSIPGFNNVATGINNAKSSTTFAVNKPDQHHNSVAVKASVQKIADMVPLIVSAITKPSFDNHDFDSAIDDVNRHLSTGSLAGLWNAIKDDSGIEAFTNHYGAATNRVTNLLNNSNDNDFKALDQAYQQAHDDGNVSTILNDLKTVANNHKNADGKSANQRTNTNVKTALNNIISTINGDNTLKSIQGMQGNNSIAQKTSTEASQYNPAIETPAKHQTTTADVQPIADMMPTIVNAITKPGFKASQFDGAIQAVESHLNDSSLSQLWNDVKGDSNVTAFTNRRGNLTKQITGLLNSNDSEVKELSQAYQQTHSDNNVKNILSDLQKIANNHLDNNGKSASHQTNVNVQNALKHIASVINGDNTLKNIQGMRNVAQNASNEASYSPAVEQPKPSTVTPSVQVLDDMLQPILNRIVAKGFDSSAFQNAVSAVQADIKNASTLSDLWADVQSNSGVQYFVGNHGGITQRIISKLSDTNSPLEAAYKAGHQDSAMTQILNDLSDISKHQQIGNNEVAKQSDVDDVNRDLSDINNQISQSNTLKNINGMTTLMNNVHYNHISVKKSATPTATVTPDVSSVAPLISKVLNRMTAANFDSRDFDNVITAIKNNINSAPSLSKLWSDIDNNSSVKHFVGPLANEITSILDDGNDDQMKSLNAAYQQGHTKVGQILTDLQTIADNHLDANDVKAQNGKRDAIRQALTDVKSQLGNSALRSIKGVDQIASDVQNGINAKQYQDQDQPHYSNNKMINSLLKGLINPSLIKSLSDKLASADFAKSSDWSVFNQILSDLKGLPNSSDPNSNLSDIGKQLPKINNPLVKALVPKFESLISQVKANDSTPEVLAAYADSLPESKSIYGGLINDLNKGMQDVKNGKNNTDYKTVLSDLMNIDANVTTKHDSTDARATQEDRNLKAIAKTIKNGGLKNIPFLDSFASVARHVAAADSYSRKYAPIHTTDKNNHINHVNHVNHVKKQRANAQHWSNVARRDRLSANNAVAAATVDAQKAERSAAAAQSFTSGLNSGSDSTNARNAASAASTDAAHASSEAARASTDAHKAMTDSVADNDSTIISDTNDARSIADQATKDANSTASEFKVAKTTAKKAGLAPHYADQTFNDTLGHLISGYTMQKLVDHLTSNNFAKSGERKAFNDVLTQLQKLPSQLSSQKNVNGTLDKISSDLNGFHGPISKGMAKKVQSLITDVEQHDATPSTLVTYANSDGADGKLINDLNAGMQTVKDGKDNQDYKSVLSNLIDLDTHPANQDHDLGEIAKTINHNQDLKIISLLKNVSRAAHQMARNANHAQQNTDGQRHAKMINDENQHRRDVVRHALISANHAASNAASIAARAVKSADAVQSNASGLNPGSASTLASSYAINASADANQMKDVASQASSLAHVARANDRGSASVVLNDTKAVDDLSSLVSDNASIVTTDAQGASKAAQLAGKALQPNVTVVASVVPQILRRITAEGFDSSDFDKAVEAAKSGLSAKTLTDFLSNFNKNASVTHFLDGNGAATQAVTKLLDGNGNLQSAYYDYHNDVNLPQILGDLEAIAAHQQVGDNLVAKDSDRTAVKNDLTDISRLVNDGRLNKIAGANDVLTAINSFNSNYKPSTKSAAKPSNVKPSLPITTNFVDHVLNRLTDSHFNKSAFASAITDGIEPALKNDSTLSDFINSIQSNPSVKSFMNSDGSVTQEIMSLLTDTTSRRLLGASKPQNQSNKSSLPQQIKADLNAAYSVAHGDYNHVDGILNLLVDISKQPLDRQGKSDPIYNDLNAIAKDIDNDSSLKSVGGMPTVAYQARHDAPHYQVVPHYADQNFNQALSDLVNNYTVQQLADHLASKPFAQSGEKEAFNRIITDLEYLPNSSNANLELSDIDSELNNFRGPLSKRVAAKVQSLIPQVEKHDSTPNALTVYANSLNNSDGNLINDLNKGFQDVKSVQNNIDYQTVLNDVMDIDQNPKREDHDLNDIAKTIRAHHLINIPVLRDVADMTRETAKSENSTRRHRDRPQQKKDANSQAAAKQKQAKDFAKRSAAKSAQSSAANQHAASRKATSLAHAKHMKARSTVSSVSAVHAKVRSAKAAQSASVKSADSSAVSKASLAKGNALSAELNAASNSNSVKSITPSVNNDVKGLMSMHNQYQGDSSLSDDAKEASNYAEQFSSDARATSLDENQTNSADVLANSDYKATSLAASANNSSLAASYANDGSQEATQASQYALSTANEMSAASQASSGIASLAHDAALQSSADVKMNSINASASSAINSAKSSKASSTKSGSKSSSKASSNNDSSVIANANARANSLANASAKASSSYVNAIKSAKAANNQSLANSFTSASKSTSQSYSAALSAANSAESAANSKASASASSASTSASIAASSARSAESSALSSAESASSNAERASESAHESAVMSGIRASLTSASQSASIAESIDAASASRSASARESAQAQSNSIKASSAESAIQSMTALIKSYADALNSAGADHGSTNPNVPNNQNDSSAIASAEASAANAENAASTSASLSASISASEAIASQEAMNNNQSRGSSEAPSNVTRDSIAGQYSQPSNVAAQNSNDSDPTSDTSDPTASNRSSDPSQDPSESDDESATDPSKKSKRVGLEAADPVSHRPGNSDPVESDEDPTSANVGSSEGLGINEDPSNGNVGTDDSGSGQLPQTGEADSEAKVVAAALLSLSAALLSVGLGLDLKHRN